MTRTDKILLKYYHAQFMYNYRMGDLTRKLEEKGLIGTNKSVERQIKQLKKMVRYYQLQEYVVMKNA